MGKTSTLTTGMKLFYWAAAFVVVTSMALLGALAEAQPVDAGDRERNQWFIKIGDIKGEATDKEHKEWIDVLSVSHGIHRPGGSATGQSRRRGAAVVEDISISKLLDKASPKLQETLLSGQVIPSVEFVMTRAHGPRETKQRLVYLKYELKNVLVTSYNIAGDEAMGTPTEDFSLNFEEIKVTYTERDKKTGSSKGNVEYTWKVEEGES